MLSFPTRRSSDLGKLTNSRWKGRYRERAIDRRAVVYCVSAAISSNAAAIGSPTSRARACDFASRAGAIGAFRYSHSPPPTGSTRPSPYRTLVAVGIDGTRWFSSRIGAGLVVVISVLLDGRGGILAPAIGWAGLPER